VSNELGVPQHVLRFWETKFAQVKPLKRGGGRRYYRPEDIALLKRIQGLLYDEGYTIKGVQRLFRDGRVKAGAKAKAPPPPERAAETTSRGPRVAQAQSGTAEAPKVTSCARSCET
jgi:DNA-binding transcriptional MerR regulator